MLSRHDTYKRVIDAEEDEHGAEEPPEEGHFKALKRFTWGKLHFSRCRGSLGLELFDAASSLPDDIFHTDKR